MTKAVSFRAALLGAGLAFALATRAQEPTPTPTAAPPAAATAEQASMPTPVVEPAAARPLEEASVPTPAPASTSPQESSPSPEREVTPECAPAPARGTFSPPQMPLPQELQGNIRLVKSGAIKISFKPPSVKPWVVKDLKVGLNVGSGMGINLSAFNAIFGFHSMSVNQSFNFRLVREDAPDGPAVTARCTWGLASSTPSVGKGSWGIEMRIPQGTSTACERRG